MTARSRRSSTPSAGYAALVGVDQAVVAVGPQVSVFAGQIAASLPAGAEVISAANEFTSVTFPFWARGLAVTEIPLADIADALTERTALVAVSAVQSHAARFTACNAWKCLCRDSCDCDVSKGLVAEGTPFKALRS
jgi:hypothetical protein